MTRRISLGCALLAILLGACQQTLMFEDLSADASRSSSGGTNGTGGSGGSKPTDALHRRLLRTGPADHRHRRHPSGRRGSRSLVGDGREPSLGGAERQPVQCRGERFERQVQNYVTYSPAASTAIAAPSPSPISSSRRAPATATTPDAARPHALPTSSYLAFTDATMTCSRPRHLRLLRPITRLAPLSRGRKTTSSLGAFQSHGALRAAGDRRCTGR